MDRHHGPARGHAGRAVALALRLMADELALHRAEASTNLDNLPSQHVLRRNGFTPYGVAHSAILLDGVWQDSLLWERVLDAEWPLPTNSAADGCC
ncbi:GNAT family N-acetyltransferase [Kitasatospora sp. NRRL B-11411]|uniref:GNAT family N-acetyltransferase n=1 Tax=Kitasatospora sp. NRRL B-11411 TaxID=1463822 RepID=UPI000B2BACBE|nr:GNAT family protein [Kitasatospora sp. NRRL B-11411]